MALFLLLATLLLHAEIPSENTKKVKAILEKSCTLCHGGAAPQLFNVFNASELASKNLVQGDVNSRFYQSLNRSTRWMPLGSNPLALDEKAAILQWLKDGYPDFDGKEPIKPPVQEGQLRYENEVRCIAEDAVSYGKKYGLDYSKFLRYVTLSPYYNLGALRELNRAHEAIDKLLNSVSLAQNIYFTKPIACNGVPNAILRINLEDFNLQPEDWDNFLINGKYPYAVAFFENEDFAFYEKEIAFFTQAQTIAFIRGDWFITHVSQPPLYYDALFKKEKVNTLQQLEKFLKVDTFEQLFKTYEAKRAIIHRSGVTNYNRIIDRYELEYVSKGAVEKAAYWKTFDVIEDKIADQKNFFAFPFGPLFTFYKSLFPKFLLDKVFNFDATEIIWENENGTLGFFLANGKEERIDFADTRVAQHHNDKAPGIAQLIQKQAPTTVVNGVSCFSCHSGMNNFVDEARNHIAKSSDFDNLEVDHANLLLYKNKQESDFYLNQSNVRYAKGATALKATKVVYLDTEEPIFASTKDYIYDTQVCKFGAELGYTCDEIKEKLYHAPEVARLLGISESLVGRASRENIERNFARIVQDLNIGVQVVFEAKKKEPPVVIKPDPVCEIVLHNKTNLYQRVEKAVFNTKTYGQEYIAPGKTAVFAEKGQATVNACAFYEHNKCVVLNNLLLEACTHYDFYPWSDGYVYISKSTEQPKGAKK